MQEDAARRNQFFILACVTLITILAWACLFRLDHQMSTTIQDDELMAAMGMAADRAWTGRDAFFTFAMWSIMMIGMMVPTALPALLMFASAQTDQARKGSSISTLNFGIGYITVWTAFSLGATLAQFGLHKVALLSATMSLSNPYVTGFVLIAAGGYQLTLWKAECLSHCRSPLGFLMTNWRNGAFGAFQMGLRHGIFCLGCCWALMCLLFAVGVMNLLWIAILTALVLIEKIGPAGVIVGRLAGTVMVIAGIAVILRS